MANIQPRKSIRNKLTLVIMAISVLLLLIVSFVVLTAELFATRTAMIQEIRALSVALGTNSRQSLVLGQYQAAERFLQALSTQPHIHAAYLFDRHGEPVAQYLPQKDALFTWKYLEQDFSSAHRSYGNRSSDEQINSSFFHLGVFTPIFYDGNRVGTLYVLSDLDPLYGRLSGVAFGITISLFLLFVFSLFLAGRLQRPILDPLLNLAEVMEKISARKDYSVRAKKMTNDEIALLVDGLNHMLDQVEEHQRQQSRLQEHLELTVDQRTAELRAAVVELEKSRRQADAANEAKTRFLSRMTHDLRTPLIGVLGMNGLLQRTSLTEQQRTLVNTVEKSGNDLLALIGDVLDIARIEAGVVDLSMEEVVPARIIEEVVELLAPQAHNKGIELLADIPLSAFCSAKGDRARIWQIVMNLVGNAIKFTSQGSVVVRLRVAPEGKTTGRLVIAVEDTGIGMDEATSQRVFDLFFQHEGLSTQAVHGSGLGLPIVRQLVDLMGGELRIDSHPGAGSCFTVALSLPLLESSRPVVTIDVSGMQILFGMTESPSATLLERQLKELNITVARAQSVDEYKKELEGLPLQEPAGRLLLLSRDWYDQLLEQGGMEAAIESAGQLAVICQDSAVDSVPGSGSTHLYQPVTWNRLNALFSGLQQKRKAVSLQQHPAVVKEMPLASEGARVVFVGRHAAQRQLLRLALTGSPVELNCVDDLDEGIALSRSSDVLLLILDVVEIAATELRNLEALTKRLPPCYLLYDHDPLDPEIPQFAGCLKKPVSRTALQEIIDPLLDQSGSLVVAAAGESF